MYNIVKKIIKKQWLQLLIALMVLSLVAMVAYAEYGVTTNVMHKVVRSVSDQGMMFSSNYLVESGSNTYIAKYVSKNSKYDIDVYIWNYSNDNISRWYPNIDIDFIYTAELTDSMGNSLSANDIGTRSVWILDSSGNELTELNSSKTFYTSTVQTLKYDESKSAESMFTIHYSDDWDLDDTEFCVRVTAMPYRNGDNNKYKDLKDISAVLGLKESFSTGSNGWRAYISEKNANKPFDKCDAYNVVVTGSGKATITLTWDTKYLDFNEYFYNSEKSIYNFNEVIYTPPTTGSDYATIKIEADTGSSATEHRNRYDIQLYKTGAFTAASWDDLEKWITMSVSASDSDE